MIVGIGTDLIEIDRIASVLARYPSRFLRRILTEEECIEASLSCDLARFLAKRWAAKEAFGKALGIGMRMPATFLDMSVTHDDLGRPGFRLSARLQWYLGELGVGRIHLSISDERQQAIAFVVLDGAEHRS